MNFGSFMAALIAGAAIGLSFIALYTQPMCEGFLDIIEAYESCEAVPKCATDTAWTVKYERIKRLYARKCQRCQLGTVNIPASAEECARIKKARLPYVEKTDD